MSAVACITNALTVDVEHWYHANYPGYEISDRTPSDLDNLVDRLRAIAEERGVRMTFFVLGSVAEEFPALVKRLHSAGHEIASHGYAHRAISTMTPAEFREDLRHSCAILEDITGVQVFGFRAPSFSVTRAELPMFYDVLEEAGLMYSSSVFPGRTFLYGIPGFPDEVHRPIINGHRRRIVEIPVPALRIGPLHLGLYLRLFPAPVIDWFITRRNRQRCPVVLYVHPREIDVMQPRLQLPRVTRFIHYFGIPRCEQTIARVMDRSGGSFRLMHEIARDHLDN